MKKCYLVSSSMDLNGNGTSPLVPTRAFRAPPALDTTLAMESTVLRPASHEDYEAFVRFFAQLGVADPVPEQGHWSASMLPTTRFLEGDGVTLGYAFVEVTPPQAYVRHVVVEQAFRGRGLGATLLKLLSRELVEAGCMRWCLNVSTDNLPARRLYEKLGFSEEYATSVVRLGWADIHALPPRPHAAMGRTLQTTEDRVAEQLFALAPGLLAARRHRPHTVIVTALANDQVHHGLAAFDANFPGAFPFRATSPAWARVLLDTMHEHRRSEDEQVQLVIEDDEALAAALVAAGARTVFNLLHLAGSLVTGPK